MIRNILLATLAMSAVRVASCENQRCYVCIPNIGSSIADVTQIFPSGPSLPLCSRFDKNKAEYVRECPSSMYVGCLTQTNGTHTTKTCSLIEVEDCKTANKIEYCYCKGQLCNDEVVPAEEARPPLTAVIDSGEDDEDTGSYAEGSGSAEESTESISFREKKDPSALDDIGIDIPTTTFAFKTSFATVEPVKVSASHHPSPPFFAPLIAVIVRRFL